MRPSRRHLLVLALVALSGPVAAQSPAKRPLAIEDYYRLDAKAREIMIRQSPLTYADRAKAPTLFINGEVDQRVPVSEAQQMFVALKKHGVPAKMIQYAGQPHGIAGSWNIVHRMLNEREWLDRWMKAGEALQP